MLSILKVAKFLCRIRHWSLAASFDLEKSILEAAGARLIPRLLTIDSEILGLISGYRAA